MIIPFRATGNAMSQARLILTYTLAIELPEPLTRVPQSDLRKTLDALLGEPVHHGLRTVVAKRLAGAGVKVVRMTHQAAVEVAQREVGKVIPKAQLIAAAPHLTDAELAEVEAEVGQMPFLAEEELRKRIRARALKRVSEVRLVPVRVKAVRSNDEPFEAEAMLNLTHGGLFFPEELRSLRFKANAPVAVYLPGVDEPLPAQYRGSTLGGPVVEVPIERLAPYRDQLIAAWQKTRQ
jgi:hypothetical protein